MMSAVSFQRNRRQLPDTATSVAGATDMSPDAVWKTVAAAVGKPAGKSILTRFYEAITQAQQRRAQHEVARYFANRGPLSDAIEREIMRRLSGPPWTR
jgi:hypothetical protein